RAGGHHRPPHGNEGPRHLDHHRRMPAGCAAAGQRRRYHSGCERGRTPPHDPDPRRPAKGPGLIRRRTEGTDTDSKERDPPVRSTEHPGEAGTTAGGAAGKAPLFGGTVFIVVAVDFITKRLVESRM